MKKPVYFINKFHKGNFLRLIKKAGKNYPDITPIAYVLAAIGTLGNSEGSFAIIDKYFLPTDIDFESLSQTLTGDAADRALLKVAANLYNSENYANLSDVFSPLNDEYQAVIYQALLVKFPSFSRSWDKKYPYAEGD
ncbi:MAG TPA: hypothetical protein PLC88_05020 [Syntrophomonas sp.]|nr:hypothetical protein [Syntrophomonas sp.]HRW12613.1 hypothetical protein [Syntrophomonas sp.]